MGESVGVLLYKKGYPATMILIHSVVMLTKLAIVLQIIPLSTYNFFFNTVACIIIKTACTVDSVT